MQTDLKLRVLVIGGGGREHALAWKLAQSPRAEVVFVAPGNAGTAHERGVRNVPIDADAIDDLLAFAQREHIDLTVVGPEGPLVKGVVDRFEQAGLKCLGPSAQAAELEGSKAYAKEFLARHRIPTAIYLTFTDQELTRALQYLATVSLPVVIKADGLAAGKGVTIAADHVTAAQTATAMLSGSAFGAAGRRIVVEEFLHGEEVSFIVLADGEDVVAFASSQDHKARDDADLGPNTGGMGAYSPAPVVTPEIHERIMNEIIRPTLQGMIADGRRYRGFLYAGLMIAPDGTVRVIEFNCRFGDPETQPVMLRLKSDLLELCLAAVEGRLLQQTPEWDTRAALGVVMAAGGYPGTYRKGDRITGLDLPPADSVKVFHAGTREAGSEVLTNGGRVLCVCALGETVAMAQAGAYARVLALQWQGAYYRTDIGYRAIAREHTKG